MRRILFSGLMAGLVLLTAGPVFSHCEIPCGIYNDQLRITMIEEDITTIEKAIQEINGLVGEEGGKNANQLMRWVVNKEEHANKIQHIVSQYFLTQKIKPVDEEKKEEYGRYVAQVTLAHQLLRDAMKTKQSASPETVEKLRATLKKFTKVYFTAAEKAHEKTHEKTAGHVVKNKI